MYGSIIGDICGSIYEFNNYKTDTPENINIIHPKCYFTDDTILSVAIADAILSDGDYKKNLLKWAWKYPKSGYGYRFMQWCLNKNPQPYNSYGNGSAMRVGSIGWAFDTLEQTIDEAKRTAEVTHNHKEGIKGAQAVAGAIFLARNNKTKTEIKEFIEKEFKYNLNKDLSAVRKKNKFEVSCQKTVPPAIMAFLGSNDFINSIQIAISLGGDTDTLACITGSIAEAFYKEIPLSIIDFINKKLDDDMKKIISKYHEKYLKNYGLEYYIKKGHIINIEA